MKYVFLFTLSLIKFVSSLFPDWYYLSTMLDTTTPYFSFFLKNEFYFSISLISSTGYLY